MPWTCPACHHPIRHSVHESDPRPGVTYRCHICRLELIADVERGRMDLAPLFSEDQPPSSPESRRDGERPTRRRPRESKSGR